VTAAALAALLTSPAFAQSQSAPENRPDAVVYPMSPQAMSDAEPGAAETYASAPLSGYGTVIVDGYAVGSDPDAGVRLQLQRDQNGSSN
jgi:hypothetical protein